MKRLLIIAFVLAVIAVIGLFVWKQSGSPKPSQKEPVKQEMQGTPQRTESTVIDSIKSAMGLGKAMQCTYTVAEGGKGVSSSVIVNGEKFKSVTEVGGRKMHGLFDGEAQYVWTEGEKQGFKMSKGCMDELKAGLPAGSEANPATAGVKDLSEGFDMAKNVTCEAAPAADLSVPTDVEFADQCEMMRQSLEMMKNVQKQMPQGMPYGN